MGVSERIELTASDLSKIAKLMSIDFKDEVNSHMVEAFEAHRTKLTDEFKEIHRVHVEEVCFTLDQQNEKLLEFDKRLRYVEISNKIENEAIKGITPAIDFYVRIYKNIKLNLKLILKILALGVILICLLFRIIHN